jgi:hypothetical protein
MAWKEGKRLGKKCTRGLMISHMHFRNRELRFRSAFPVEEVGKSRKDAWNKTERVYLDRSRCKDGTRTIGEIILSTKTTPLDYAISNDFLNSLSKSEKDILEDLSAGYTQKEIAKRHHVTQSHLKSIRTVLASKAIEYLV